LHVIDLPLSDLRPLIVRLAWVHFISFWIYLPKRLQYALAELMLDLCLSQMPLSVLLACCLESLVARATPRGANWTWKQALYGLGSCWWTGPDSDLLFKHRLLQHLLVLPQDFVQMISAPKTVAQGVNENPWVAQALIWRPGHFHKLLNLIVVFSKFQHNGRSDLNLKSLNNVLNRLDSDHRLYPYHFVLF